MELIMILETRKSFVEKMLKKSPVVKKKSSFTKPNLIRFSDRDVLKITEKWRQIKTPPIYMGSGNSVDVFNHEDSEQFLEFSFNEWKESNSLTTNKSYWTDEVCNLISRHKDDFDSEEEYESRLNECLEISNKYN
jgi:hypothetical protein